MDVFVISEGLLILIFLIEEEIRVCMMMTYWHFAKC
jgi:hypothetical protein